MRYSQIRKIDISDGPGIRVTLYTQGCNIHCKDCYNSEIWNYEGGKEWTQDTRDHLLELCNKPHIAGLSVLGGEPLSPQNYNELIDLFKAFKSRFPDKTIWMWTGRTIESLDKDQLEVVKLVDVLVDGPFMIEKADFKLKYCGSSNQRVINIPLSLKNKRTLLKEV